MLLEFYFGLIIYSLSVQFVFFSLFPSDSFMFSLGYVHINCIGAFFYKSFFLVKN